MSCLSKTSVEKTHFPCELWRCADAFPVRVEHIELLHHMSKLLGSGAPFSRGSA